MFEQEGDEDSIRQLIAQNKSAQGSPKPGYSRISGNTLDEALAKTDRFLQWRTKRQYLTLDGKPAHPNARRADGTMMSWDEYEHGGGKEREDRRRKWRQEWPGSRYPEELDRQ